MNNCCSWVIEETFLRATVLSASSYAVYRNLEVFYFLNIDYGVVSATE